MPAIPGSRVVDPITGTNVPTPRPLPKEAKPAPAEVRSNLTGAPVNPPVPFLLPLLPGGVAPPNPLQFGPVSPLLPDATQPPPLPPVEVPSLETGNLFSSESESRRTTTGQRLGGAWALLLHGNTRLTYDSNIFISERNRAEDVIFSVAPAISVGVGDYVADLVSVLRFQERFETDRSEAELPKRYAVATYKPQLQLFSDHTEENSFDHDVEVKAKYTFSKLEVGVAGRYYEQNLPDVDIGRRIEQKRATGAITSKYNLAEKTSLEANLYGSSRQYEDARPDINEYRVQTWVNYQVRPKVNAGLGYAHGWVDVEGRPNQSFNQVLLRTRYSATAKLSVEATGGVEFRSIQDGEDQTNSTFTFGATFRPFEATTTFLKGYRRTTTSASGFGTNYTSTGLDFSIQQRLFQKYYAQLLAGYQLAEYEPLSNVFPDEREDDTAYVRLSLGFDVNRFLSAELGYEYRKNDSSDEDRSFEQNLIYFQFVYLF